MKKSLVILLALLGVTPAMITLAAADNTKDRATAYFAGGCFWCMEPPFDQHPGVISTTSGYMGGTLKNPTYEQVSAGTSGHAEAIRVEYDPTKVNYGTLLEIFWRNIDPLDDKGQFCDRGNQYRSEIFVADTVQKSAAEKSRAALAKGILKDFPIATGITPATQFYPAETYHQDYYQKNPVRYKYYRYRCGRDARLEELWGVSGH